jgi:glycerol-3-phosphate dehydrogenase (NAD(P)+)
MDTAPCPTAGPIADQIQDSQILVSCTKGILNDTLETVNEILERVLPARLRSRLAYLSGPSFAAEVAQCHPTLVTIASKVSL